MKVLYRNAFKSWIELRFMGCVELGEIEAKILSICNNFYWSQRVVNHAQTLLDLSQTDDKIKLFFSECENKVKSGTKGCRIAFNNETYNFGGDEFAYIFFFYSDVLSIPIKLSVNIDTFEQTIVFGNMTLPTKKEEKKLEKHLNNEQGISLNNSIDLNKQEVAK